MEREDIVFYREIEQKFVAFAEGREDIRAAFIIGSRARTDHPADRLSGMQDVLCPNGSVKIRRMPLQGVLDVITRRIAGVRCCLQ